MVTEWFISGVVW